MSNNNKDPEAIPEQKTAMERISEIIDRYNRVPAVIQAEAKNINALLFFRRSISCDLGGLGEEVSFFRKERDRKEWAYKMAVNEFYQGYRKEGDAQETAKKKAETKAKNHKSEFIEAEGNYEQARMFYQTTNAVLNALAGDIRMLEYEYQKINYSQT